MRPGGAVALLPALVAASAAWAERLPIQAYSTAQGLGSSFVVRVVGDSRGFLWFCTRNGLSRFDGERFAHYGVAEGLPHPTINDVFEAADGTYWIATNGGGVARLDPRAPAEAARIVGGRRFAVLSVGSSPHANRVNRLAQDGQGRIWAATDGGLFRLRDLRDGFAAVELGVSAPSGADAAVNMIVPDGQGGMWVALDFHGLRRVGADGTLERVTTREGLPSDRVLAVLPEGGQVWVGTARGLAVVTRDGAGRLACSRLRATSEGRAGDDVTDILRTRDGRFFLASSRGLIEGQGAAARRYVGRHGLVQDELTSLAEDQDGNVWMGTPGSGAMKLTRGGFVHYDEADAPGLSRIHSVFEGSDGAIYATSGDWYVHRVDAEGMTTVRLPVPRTPVFWLSPVAYRDRRGGWWVPTSEGLLRFAAVARLGDLARARPLAVYGRANGLGEEVAHVYEDSRGDVWFSASSGRDRLARWERATGAVRVFGEADGLPPSELPQAFVEDRAGDLWFGLDEGGVVRFRGGRFRVFRAGDGWPRAAAMGTYCDRAGRLWIATNAEGLLRVDDPAAERPRPVGYTTAQGLSSDNTRCLAEDELGRIYVGTARGVDRLDPATGRMQHFTTTDGLSSDFLIAAARDHSGRLWFGTLKGLSRLDPRPDRPSRPPPVLVSGLTIAGVPHTVSEIGETGIDGLRLAPDENRLQFQFLSTAFGLGRSVRFRYRLEPAESEWSPPSNERSVSYAGLPPGRYRFLVEAVSSEGLESPAPATVSFSILPPLWRRWWFLSAAAMAVAGLAYAFHRARVRRLVAVERVRTRIATDLHDDLGASLSRVAILSEVAKGEVQEGGPEALRLLDEIAETARDLLVSTSDIVWSIHPQRDDLHSLAARVRGFASELLEGRGIQCRLVAPEDGRRVALSPELRWHLLLILKEALHNIVRHAGARRATMALGVSGGRLWAEVEDDGCGFSPEALGRQGGAAAGHGLRNMHARAAEIAGTLTVDSVPGRGTRLRLEAPLS